MSRSSQQTTSDFDQPDPVLSAYELGQTIREMRVALQRDINDVAADLRIKVAYLKAIEDGRFRDLPGPAYATGFVRAYADYLGANSNEVVRLYKEAIGGGESRTALVLPSPVEEGRLPTGSVLLVAGVLAVAAYGGWYYLSLQGHDALDVVAGVSAPVDRPTRSEKRATPAVSASIDLRGVSEEAEQGPGTSVTPVATGPSPSRDPRGASTQPPAPAYRAADRAPPPSAPAPAAVVAEEAAPPQTVAAGDEAAEPAAPEAKVADVETPLESDTVEAPSMTQVAETPVQPTTTPPPPPPAPDIAPVTLSDLPSVGEGPAPPQAAEAETPQAEASPPPDVASNEPVVGPPIVLRASSAAWVEVRDGRDRPVYSGLLRAGESVNLPRLKGLTLNTGNAGGLQIIIDGRTLPSLGPLNAVRRNISLDLESLSSASR